MESFLKCCKALGDGTRFAIFERLLERSYCVNALAKQLYVTQSAVSQHMRVLREAGLVVGEKRGYHVHYSVSQDGLDEFRRFVQELQPRGQGAKGCCGGHSSEENEWPSQDPAAQKSATGR